MRKKIVKRSLAWIGLFLGVIWSVFPILFIFTSSFTNPKKIFIYPPSLISKPTLQNYIILFREWPKFWGSLRNSLIIAMGAIILTLIVSLPASYAFSRFRSKYIRFSGLYIIVARMFPPIIITIPLYPLLRYLGLIDNHITLIILYCAFYLSIATWILKNFLDNVPKELEEAAFIEGCTRRQAFIRILLPLSAPGLVSVSILVAIFCWKEFLFAFLFTTSNAVTAPVVLNEMLGSMFGVSWGPVFAAASIQLLPILVFIWLVQKFLIRGISYSSMK